MTRICGEQASRTGVFRAAAAFAGRLSAAAAEAGAAAASGSDSQQPAPDTAEAAGARSQAQPPLWAVLVLFAVAAAVGGAAWAVQRSRSGHSAAAGAPPRSEPPDQSIQMQRLLRVNHNPH